ncbi:MAG: 4Fe-4S binding protein [Lachnospiraceae bacterium]|nr:4Fe-4S binding protein [Lachnospiraceae bacterium]
MSIAECGFLTYDELKEKQTLPSDARYSKGPVAVIECVQEIPCNPCEAACQFGAIHIGDPITSLPSLTAEKCVGCGVCVSRCPGLAIFVVNKSYTKDTATVSFPYEYEPVPKEGEVHKGLNRRGEPVCEGKIVKVLNPVSYDHTPVVTIEIPKQYADEVRSIERERGKGA